MFHCDVLHVMIEGNFIHLLKATAKYLEKRRLFSNFNISVGERMRKMPSFTGLELSHNSIFQLSLYTGKVCSNIMKVVAHLMRSNRTNSASPMDNLVKAWDLYVDIYYYAKLPSHNWQTIRDFKGTIAAFYDSLHLVHGKNPDLTLFKSQTSHWNYPKFHAMTHFLNVRLYTLI
jgi:hypothetical protein